MAAGETWLSAPWCVAEFYFYRRVMEALSFYQKDAGIALPSFFDPFLTSKQKGLESALGSVEELAPRVLDAIDAAGKEDSGTSIASSLRLFILISLWGNRMDLSLWPAGSQGNVADSFSQVLGQGEINLLADDFGSLFDLTLEAKAAGGKRFDIIVDNAGFELITDLLMADYLVSSGIASEVVFQLKSHPTFVSDARASDLVDHVSQRTSLISAHLHISEIYSCRLGCSIRSRRWHRSIVHYFQDA